MPEWLIGFITAVAVVIIGSFLSWYQRLLRQRDEERAAVAALRFELESNLHWLDEIFETHNYLRDEAWVSMKNNGYISHLHKPIPRRIIEVYDKIHRMNEQVRIMKENGLSAKEEPANPAVTTQIEKLQENISELNKILDQNYPEVGRNF